MNITKNIISDLFPLYLENECTPDTRELIQDYLQRNPQEAEELRRVAGTTLPKPSLANLDETHSLRQARRVVRRRSWVMGLAIFFSLAPLSFHSNGERIYWMPLEAPGTALVYALLAVTCWVIWAMMRFRSRSL
jgi:hypothetical protein